MPLQINMLVDDLPWPELGNVSRGATRGNQGQKGMLGPPDSEGRCTLQLRVQPGVLAVRLNRQASDWYRILDGEVNRALKMTKTYWRKARRRQDYDARADQDHMELHEWLQQLKDRVMSHMELLMQKGEIQGPPYTMPDDLELTFLRKFIERQNSGIPHNPRLRRAHPQNSGVRVEQHVPQLSEGTSTPAVSVAGWEAVEDKDHSSPGSEKTPPHEGPFPEHGHRLVNEIDTNRRALHLARANLSQARKGTQDTFMRYTACLDDENKARQELSALEERRDDLMSSLAKLYRRERIDDTTYPFSTRPGSRDSTSDARNNSSINNQGSLSTNITAQGPETDQWKQARDVPWGSSSVVGTSGPSRSQLMGLSHANLPAMSSYEHNISMETYDRHARKHSRNWEDLHATPAMEEISSPLPPRKRPQMMTDAMRQPVHQADPPVLLDQRGMGSNEPPRSLGVK